MIDSKPQDTIETWAIVELMGHQRMAGYVSTISLGGASMLRITVPEHEQQPAYDRIVNPAAIYAINPCDEATARMLGARLRPQPLAAWEMQAQVQALPAPNQDETNDQC